ncbi:unnamed protein product [Sphagnum jensenii]|uniref:RING-type E3 ubiquitin transferase n=1 Tax=Sphagnum jensenii TaxID=128206 RepID=A0ABP1AD06_9BRYO
MAYHVPPPAPSSNNHSRRQVMAAQQMILPASPSSSSLVQNLVNLAQQVAMCERSAVCQKRNGANISRIVKLLSPLLEEIRDSLHPLPPSAVMVLHELQLIMQRAKQLLDECRKKSCFCLLMRIIIISEEFYNLMKSLSQALESLPLELLELSDEIKEQVELVRMQVQRGQLYVDPVEEHLYEEVADMLRNLEREEIPDLSGLRKLFTMLHLNSSGDCEREMQKLEDELTIDSDNPDNMVITSLISFVHYGKCVLYGVMQMEGSENSSREPGNSCVVDVGELSSSGRGGCSSSPPDEFRCPISLDLMSDPVIVASGHTYDRASITRWIDAGNQTCFKSGQKLSHLSLIPNYALRSLISQWCEDHHIPFDKQDKVSKKGSSMEHIATTKAALEATKVTASFLVGKLVTGSPEAQKQAAYELRLLAKCSMDNRMCIADAGAIPLLVSLLSSKDSKTQENAVTALLNLSIFDKNKVLIMAAEALDPIIEVLRSATSMEARENAAATLFSLSVVDDYKVQIGSKPMAINALVVLLRDGTPQRGKKDAATALLNLAVYHDNKPKIVSAGIVPIIISLLQDDEAEEIRDDTLAVLALIAGCPDGLAAINIEATAIPVLVGLLRSGSSRGKENAIVVLHALCKSGGEEVLSSVLQLKVARPSLNFLLTVGTPRAKRRAISILKLLQRWEPVDYSTSSNVYTSIDMSTRL